tara:strand:+ start:230 stop:466 length:237 start_codon:yes stop_codon:yes gene_type:complete
MKWEEFLSKVEIGLRKWARENYKPLDPIKGYWAITTQEECVKMNRENLYGLEADAKLGAAKLGVNYTKQRVQKWEETK